MTRSRERTRTPSLLSSLTLTLLCTASAPAVVRADDGPARVLEQADAHLGKGFVSLPASGVLAEGADRTLAPYLYVAGGDPGTDRLPLKGVSAEVDVAGVIARVRVHQRFENSGPRPIEAVYVFPASARAAVHGMRMQIGARRIEAKIERKQAARQQYQQARQAGRRASLLEQERENVFTMSVANLMPGDRIEVELDYSELLVPDSAVYELVFPTVVGPRYGGGADAGMDRQDGQDHHDQWIASPYLPEGAAEPFPFDIKVHLESGIALKEVSSPSHPIQVRYASPTVAEVTLERPGGGNKDFVLRYRLAGDQVEAGALLYPGQGPSGDGYFVAMIEPPARPAAAQVVAREYLFVLDVSGSMHGFPLETAKALMRRLLSTLRPGEWFNVVLFSGTSFTMSPHGSLPATPANIDAALELVDHQRGGGGTELLEALRAAYAVPRTGGDSGALSRSVVVVTDGYVGVEAQAFQFIRQHLDEANLFSFGIGSSVNRSLIEGMARAGQGEPFVVLSAGRAAAEAERLRAYVDAPVLTAIRAELDGFDASDVAPQHIPDLMARRPIVLFGRYHGAARGKLRLRGRAAGGAFTREIDLASAPRSAHNVALRHLWARKWVQVLDDERAMAPGEAGLAQAITHLGLEHGLLTAFTSFVAVDSQVANPTGRAERVDQPLPLPEGVSNLAVGGAVGQGTLGTHGSGYGYGYGSGQGKMGLLRPPSPIADRKVARDEAEARPRAAVAAPAQPPAKSRGGVGSVAAEAPGNGEADRASHRGQPSALPPAGPLESADKSRDAAAARAARSLTIRVSATHLGDAGPVVRAVEEAVRAALAGGLGHPGRFTVQVTLDRSGKVTQLDLPGLGDARLEAALRARLARAAFPGLAVNGAEATVAVLIELQP